MERGSQLIEMLPQRFVLFMEKQILLQSEVAVVVYLRARRQLPRLGAREDSHGRCCRHCVRDGAFNGWLW